MPGHDLIVRGGEHRLVDTCVGFHTCYSYIGASKKVQRTEEMGILFQLKAALEMESAS